MSRLGPMTAEEQSLWDMLFTEWVKQTKDPFSCADAADLAILERRGRIKPVLVPPGELKDKPEVES